MDQFKEFPLGEGTTRADVVQAINKWLEVNPDVRPKKFLIIGDTLQLFYTNLVPATNAST